ncbi:NAD-dependent DNA ligase LigA, partial [Candidatus Peregrinibacteria bacterium]|nr:NAD-dependent DNA ligase LigA [Candidatus Peregrinibacteria bacterium]
AAEEEEEFSILDLIETVKNFSLEEIISIDGVGDVIGKSIYDWFNKKENLDLLVKLYKCGVSLNIDDLKSTGKLLNKNFVLTGTLEELTRDQAKDLIKKNGGKVQSGITKDTDFLIAGEESGSKLKKAKGLGIKIINEAEFQKLL